MIGKNMTWFLKKLQDNDFFLKKYRDNDKLYRPQPHATQVMDYIGFNKKFYKLFLFN
jgi:hypothetical protein